MFCSLCVCERTNKKKVFQFVNKREPTAANFLIRSLLNRKKKKNKEMTQTMNFTHGEERIIDSVRIATAHLPIKKRYEQKFKCSFDLGSKKHRILDEQYTNGKNYVDISLLDLGDLLRRYADGAENVKSREEFLREAKKEMEEKEEKAREMRRIAEQRKQNARKKQENAERLAREAQEKKRKIKEQQQQTPTSTPVKKQKKVTTKETFDNTDNSSNDSGATIVTKTPKKPRSLTASQKKSQSSLSVDTKVPNNSNNNNNKKSNNNNTTTAKSGSAKSDSENNEAEEANNNSSRKAEEPEEEKPLTDEELARRMHVEMNASPRLGRNGGRNRGMSLLGNF